MEFIIPTICLIIGFALGWFSGIEKQSKEDKAIMNYYRKREEIAIEAHDRIYQAALDIGLDEARKLRRRN